MRSWWSPNHRSAVRQVIVFRHDLLFLSDVEDAAGHQTPSQTRHIRRSAATVGLVNNDLPWEGMKIAARVDSLEKRARSLTSLRASADEETYKGGARHFYDDLRAAWERALEEVAFAHVVMRHRDYIKVQGLPSVSALTQQDCQSWSANFGKCCGLMAAHGESRGRNRAMPEPVELLRDVQALDTWVRNLRDRQKAVQASPPQRGRGGRW